MHVVGLEGYDAVAYYDADCEFQGDVLPVLRCAASGGRLRFSLSFPGPRCEKDTPKSSFHLLKEICFCLFVFPVGFKGNLSLLDILFYYFLGGEKANGGAGSWIWFFRPPPRFPPPPRLIAPKLPNCLRSCCPPVPPCCPTSRAHTA